MIAKLLYIKTKLLVPEAILIQAIGEVLLKPDGT